MTPISYRLLRVLIVQSLRILLVQLLQPTLQIVKLALQVEQVPCAEVTKFAINCTVAVLRDKFGEGRIAVQSAGQARRSSGQLNIWIAQSSCHEAIQFMARWLWSWKSPSLGHRLWAANES